MENAPKFLQRPRGFATRAIHAGQDPEQWNSRAVVPPISLATTFKQPEPGVDHGFNYSRGGNPTRQVLETCLASIEGAKFALTLSSGVAVITTLVSLLKTGDDIIIGDNIYGGSTVLFRDVAEQFGMTVQQVDPRDIVAFQNAIKPTTKLVWVETPSNPCLDVVDLKRLSVLVKNHSNNALLVVDNTFMTPYFQTPLNFGVDIVAYSLTKFMNGHSDICMGAACLNNEELYQKIKFKQYAYGTVPSPFDCYMVNRSLKTLHVRMEQHCRSALAVAKFLEQHPQVTQVRHPGLPSHPHHEIALRQSYGHSGMVAFYVAGDKSNATRFLQSMKLVTLCTSLGGDLSTATLPSIMSHSVISQEERDKLGISDTLVRLSVGLEDTDDLIEDLKHALDVAYD